MLDEWNIPTNDNETAVTPAVIDKNLTIEQCLAAGAGGVDISNEHYHALPGISGSNLALLAESNRHLDNKDLFNLGESDPLTFGTLLHTLVLEPHDVEKNYAILQKLNLRTNAGKEEKQAFEQKHQGKIVINEEAFEKAQTMARNVMAICGDIINAAIKERSIFAKVEGLILKIRLDADMEDMGDDYDLKSVTLGTKDFSDRTLEHHIKKLGYHRSAAFRNIVRESLGKPVRNSYLIFCNTGPGHMVRVVQIHPLWVEQAKQDVYDLIDKRTFYLESGVDSLPATIGDHFRENNY